MALLTQQLYLLITDYIYDDYLGIKSDSLVNLKKLIKNNINSFSDVVNLVDSINNVEGVKSKVELRKIFETVFLENNSFSNMDLIKLYFENDTLNFIKPLIENSMEEVVSFLKSKPLNKEQINRYNYLFLSKGLKDLVDFDVQDSTIDIIYPRGLVLDNDVYFNIIRNYKKFSPAFISGIINNSKDYNLPFDKIKEIIGSASDSSIIISLELSGNFENDKIILSKFNEIEFYKYAINNITFLKDNLYNMPNGIKINILKLFLTGKNILNLDNEDILELFQSIDDKSLNLTNTLGLESKTFEYILDDPANLNKFTPNTIHNIISFDIASTLLYSKKLELFEYSMYNNLFDFHYFIGVTPAMKNMIKDGVPEELLTSILNSGKFDKYKIKTINKTFSKESAIRYLTNPLYYEQLDSRTIIYMLNSLPKEELLEILNDKFLILQISPEEFGNILDLEFEDIINNDYICAKIDTSYIQTSILDEINIYGDFEILSNPNVSRILFGPSILLSENDIEFVEYLIDYANNKGDFNQNLNLEVLKSFVALYFSLGEVDAINFIDSYNKDITVEKILKIKDRLLQAKVNSYRVNNFERLNMIEKVFYQLNLINNPEKLYDISDSDFQWFVQMGKKYDVQRMESLFNRYIVIKNDPSKSEEFNQLKSDIRIFFEYIRNKIVLEVTSQYDKELMSKVALMFRLKPEIENKVRSTVENKSIISVVVQKAIKTMSSESKEKEELLAALKANIDLNGISDFKYFEEEMFMKMMLGTFDKQRFIYSLGFSKPNNYGNYLFNKNIINYVEKANLRFRNHENKNEILEYILSTNNDKDFIFANKIKYALSRFKDYLYLEDGQIKYNLKSNYDEQECESYYLFEKRINHISKEIYNIIQSQFSAENIEINSEGFDGDYKKVPINSRYYNLKKQPFSISEIGQIFNGFDFSNIEVSSKEKLKQFLLRNSYNLRLSINTENQYYINDFGYILSHFDKINYICRLCDINIEDVTIEEIKLLQDYIMLDLSPLEETYDKQIISDIIKKVKQTRNMTPNERLKINSMAFEQSLKRNSGTIPLLNSGEYEILDYHDPRVLSSKMHTESCFGITGYGNNFALYCMAYKNGSIIYIKHPETKEDIARISAVRRGNAYFLHELQIEDEYENKPEIQKYCEEVIQKLADDIIRETSKSEEPIEFVTIKDYKLNYGLTKKEILEPKYCEYSTDPIDVNSEDYLNLTKNPLWVPEMYQKSLYHNYDFGETYIISSAEGKNKTDFKDYDAKALYFRKRKSVEFLDHESLKLNIYEKKLRKILYLEQRKINDEFESTRISNFESLESIKNVYLGEDFCVIIYMNNEIKVINLNYDERSLDEIELIKQELGFEGRNL